MDRTSRLIKFFISYKNIKTQKGLQQFYFHDLGNRGAKKEALDNV
jgi:hypothetical protein